MNNTIIRDYDIVENAKNELRKNATDMAEKLELIKKEYRDLPEKWDGIASEKVVSELEEISSSFNQLNESVEKCANLVEKTVQNYRNADQAIKNSANA